MPPTLRQKGRMGRVNIRVAEPLMDEVDKIVRKYPGLSYNRQQFVETAIREKVERTLFISPAKAKIQSSGEQRQQ